ALDPLGVGGELGERRVVLGHGRVEVPQRGRRVVEERQAVLGALGAQGRALVQRPIEGDDAGEELGVAGQCGYSSSPSPLSPMRRMTIRSASIVTSTGRCPAQYSA